MRKVLFKNSTQSQLEAFSCPLEQRSPTLLAPGTGFMEDKFSTDRGMVQVVMRAMGSVR